MLTCKFCGKRASTILTDTFYPVCKECFMEHFEKKVIRTIREYKMFDYNDRIAVAYSGGKDSTVLLHLLHKIEENFPKSELFVITIDEGIKGYRDDALKVARENVKELGLEHHIFSFKELYGATLDEIVEISKGRKNSLKPCSYCGILRRYAINVAARELGATKVATGHNLDDEAQSFLINLLRKDIRRIGHLYPFKDVKSELFVKRVKPLRKVSERDIVLYAYFKDLKFHEVTCPYASYSVRNFVRKFINEVSQVIPNVRQNLLKSLDYFSRKVYEEESDKEIKLCKVCKEPTSGEICKRCEVLIDLGLIDKNKLESNDEG
ncbi:TIGR00269 family protein [Thermococci archaeon]|nr:MAG: TIGR00269 family protein [Thermococci archaeon]